MRGEKYDCVPTLAGFQGSPPHARGKEDGLFNADARFGITPACAGKSHQQKHRFNGERDHPRMRGEKEQAATVLQRCGGSPPHARGKVPTIIETVPQIGITPACAGKSHLLPESRRRP